ncbi:MAG TPA: DUF58 domain-containing protein [Steroidobacteraceae bacterium]|nr:DUF58 domain-containing protein [Steroidobacteraceae bacterium]
MPWRWPAPVERTWHRLRAAPQRRMAAWVRQRQGPDQPPLVLQRRRLYILPTRAGWGFALLLLLMLIAGLNYANSIALLVTFLLAGLALVAMHACHRNLLRLTVGELTADPAFAGGHARLYLRLAETTGVARPGLAADGAGIAAVDCDLAARAAAGLELALPASRRGLLPLPRLRITTTFPCGLFRAWTWLHVPLAVLVYPRPLGSRPLPAAPGARHGGLPAGGQADEWSGLRPFREGDSPRQVAWKAYARGAPLMVKEYSAAGSAERSFDFNTLAGMDTEQRLSQLARWVVDAEAAGERYTLTLPGMRIAPDRGHAHRHRCLAALALHGSAGSHDGG